MLADYPTLINTVALIRPVNWTEEYGTIENSNQTEAGTDVVDVTRRGKMTITASYKCSSFWAKKFIDWYSLATLTVKIYDPSTDGYVEHTMRMRNLKKKTIKNSEKISYGNGLYEVSFKLVEF